MVVQIQVAEAFGLYRAHRGQALIVYMTGAKVLLLAFAAEDEMRRILRRIGSAEQICAALR